MDAAFLFSAAVTLIATHARHVRRRCRPRLILHFDVNKTITMMDSVQKKKCEHLINELIACSTWGLARDGKWVWNGKEPSALCSDPRCCTYNQFLSKEYPAVGDKAEKKRIKALRKDLKTTFTDRGCAGEGLAAYHGCLLKNLEIPPHIAHTDAARAAGLKADHRLLVDAFFELLIHLQSTHRSFNILLRTFGADIDDVAIELNAFCEGKHPLYPNVRMDGSHGGLDYRVKLSSISAKGTFYRDTSHGATLVMGTTKQPKETDARTPQCPSDFDFYSSMSGVEMIRSDSTRTNTIANYLSKLLEIQGTTALRDDWSWWTGNDEVAHCGKLFLVDPADASNHAIFLDDNIKAEDAHIVDVRTLDGEPLPFSHTKDVYALRVEPLRVLADSQYFIKLVTKAEDARRALL